MNDNHQMMTMMKIADIKNTQAGSLCRSPSCVASVGSPVSVWSPIETFKQDFHYFEHKKFITQLFLFLADLVLKFPKSSSTDNEKEITLSIGMLVQSMLISESLSGRFCSWPTPRL